MKSLPLILTALLAYLLAWQVAMANPGNRGEAVNNAWSMPAFQLSDLNGKQHGLEDWRGKVIILNFWATWCPPCIHEVPFLVEMQARDAGRGLQVVSIGMDEPRKLSNFAANMGINYPVLVASKRSDYRLLSEWGNPRNVLPFTVVIGRDGHLHFMREGELDEEAYSVYVEPLLAAATASHP